MPSTTNEPIEYITNHVKLGIRDPGGSVRYLEVQTKYISPSSVAFVTSSFLHNASIVVIDLPRPDGTPLRVRGTIRDCRYNGGKLHICLAELDNKLDMNAFARPTTPSTPKANTPLSMSIGVSSGAPKISVLYIDDLDADRLLMQHKTKNTPIRLTAVDSPGSACDKLKLDTFNAVVCDFHLDGITGIDVMRSIRPDLFTGPVVIATAESREQELIKIMAAGADAVITKPLDITRLTRTLRSLLESDDQTQSAAFDPFDIAPEDESLARSYIPMLTRFRDEFLRARSKRDVELAQRACRSVLGSAEGFGFHRLGQNAERAAAAIESANNIDLAGNPVKQFAAHMQTIIDAATKHQQTPAETAIA